MCMTTSCMIPCPLVMSRLEALRHLELSGWGGKPWLKIFFVYLAYCLTLETLVIGDSIDEALAVGVASTCLRMACLTCLFMTSQISGMWSFMAGSLGAHFRCRQDVSSSSVLSLRTMKHGSSSGTASKTQQLSCVKGSAL